MHLGLTAVSECWPQARPIVFLGNWCLGGDGACERKDLGNSVLPYHFDDRGKLYDAADYCERIYEELLAQLVLALNDLHGVKSAKGYWRIILGPWLYHYVHTIYDRYLSLKQALEKHSDIVTIGIDEASYITPSTTWNFLQLITDDPFNLQLYSQILHLLGGRMRRASLNFASNNIGGIHHNRGKINKFARSAFDRIGDLSVLMLFVSRCPVWTYKLYLPARLHSKLMLSSKFRLFPMEFFLHKVDRGVSSLPKAYSLRNSIKASVSRNLFLAKDEFLNILVELLPVNMPKALVEGYSYFRKELSHLDGCRPRVMLSSVGYEVSDSWNYLCAEKSLKGTKLIGTQHGGGYGSFLYHPIEEHEHKITYEWWTWGWDKGRFPQARPMPSPKLSELARRFRDGGSIGKHLLIVSNNFPRYLYRIWSNPIGPQCREYREWLIRFIQSIGEHLRPEILLRLHHNDRGVRQKEQIHKMFADLRFDDHSVSFHDRLEEARLVVCDNQHTTFLESLAANKPTIIFWDPSRWEIRPEAQRYFDELRSAGILHDSPESAAEAVRKYYADPLDWWESQDLQEIRGRFTHRFARTSDNWLAIWTHKLMSRSR